jgi:N-methylhydantoinase B
LNVDGGVGAGRNRGGYGSVREYEVLSENAVLSASFGRSIEKPWGMDKGQEGSCNFFELNIDGKKTRAARAPTTVMKRGDRISMHTGGGGGHGNPHDRSTDKVLEEVQSGYITAEMARDQYGVVIFPDGLNVNESATKKLRQEGVI